ncbi:electron transfer flavoprotein subunit beta/FixA family protein [Vallitalea sp.]|jgi:electron transfer flavoprotein beta subunit|uniref:electron transfer flavoprotein subunit beta/FixA family protein n=1 Tax=Vallitalea sp. TaxID=1882829 RepID=UPI0025FC73E5|nr:electron transfer flavoprotein subunit beta/FixA family protein [Vallitalea sp.]MCT4688964.1 electron transfer flavoprotein subunit beta/FixA family protein [Vallitalea sp.]
MNIVVCIKQVPDTTEVKINPETGTLIRDGIPSIINPDDKRGLEAALTLKDKYGGIVTVITMGPQQAKNAIREALAMGADEGILLSDRAFAGADTWATSTTISKALEKLDYDLIIAGRQAIDGDTAQVGPQIAEHLKIPHVSYVENLMKKDDKLILKRAFEDGYHIIEVKMPCLITTLSEMNKPRYMSVRGIIDAYREKEIKIWKLDDLDIDDRSTIGLKGSPTKVKKSFTKGAKTAGKVFVVDNEEAASIIIKKLQEKYII